MIQRRGKARRVFQCLSISYASIVLLFVGDSMGAEQIAIRRVEMMPNLPEPYQMRDWKQVAWDYDEIAFDFNRTGEHLPLIWWDKTHTNIPKDMFGMPSYVGDPRMTQGAEHEAINCLAAVIGATLVGIDKSDQGGVDWVGRCVGYFVERNHQSVFLNKVSAETGYTFWYELFPNILAFQLIDLYPDAKEFTDKIEAVADQWYKACVVMGGRENPWSLPDFNHTAFDLRTMQAVDNGRWIEPDAAAAIAWLEYMAYCRTGDEKYLTAVDWSLQFLDRRRSNPFYEVLLPYGAYIAARMNAEQSRGYHVQKLVDWCFEPSDARYGWGITAERWGKYDCHGLVGSLVDGGGYAFAMNTFEAVGGLVPMVRYDNRFARAIGKWVLNAANASRLFYSNGLPGELQTCEEWAKQYDPNAVFTYEGIRKEWKGKSPYAMGDPLVHGWANTDFALYGSSHVGILGGIIRKTNQEGILQLDCLRTDYFGSDAYPTYLYYNPHSTERSVMIRVGPTPKTLYDAVSNEILKEGATEEVPVPIPPDSAALITIIPGEGEWTHQGNRTWVDGIVVDYDNGKAPRSTSVQKVTVWEPVPFPDRSVVLRSSKANIQVDGDPSDWSDLESDSMSLNTAAKGDLTCDVRFAWNSKYLFMLAEEGPGDTTLDEARTNEEYTDAPWNYDGICLLLDLDNSNDWEAMGDIKIWFGWSSTGRTDLYCVRRHIPGPLSQNYLPGIQCSTQGSVEDNSRVIETAIPWEDLARQVHVSRQPAGGLVQAVKAGLRFGCDPLLLDDGWEAQAYIGGEKHPSGRDEHSRDILLIE